MGNTDRSLLITRCLSNNDFIEVFTGKIDALTSHCYIAKYQSLYLTARKENLGDDNLIVLADFAENYASFCLMKFSSTIGVNSTTHHILSSFT